MPSDKQNKQAPESEFTMPAWMDCTWRRVPCWQDDCPLCGRIKQDRQKHLDRGEDPDTIEAVLEDAGANLQDALAMIKQDAEEQGIDIENIDDIQEPPRPEEFKLYKQVKQWTQLVRQLRQEATQAREAWLETEAAADLFWYAGILGAKTYRQLCNRWHLQQGDAYGEEDYKYTQYVLEEILKLIFQALKELKSAAVFYRQVQLKKIVDDLLELAPKITQI